MDTRNLSIVLVISTGRERKDQDKGAKQIFHGELVSVLKYARRANPVRQRFFSERCNLPAAFIRIPGAWV